MTNPADPFLVRAGAGATYRCFARREDLDDLLAADPWKLLEIERSGDLSCVDVEPEIDVHVFALDADDDRADREIAEFGAIQVGDRVLSQRYATATESQYLPGGCSLVALVRVADTLDIRCTLDQEGDPEPVLALLSSLETQGRNWVRARTARALAYHAIRCVLPWALDAAYRRHPCAAHADACARAAALCRGSEWVTGASEAVVATTAAASDGAGERGRAILDAAAAAARAALEALSADADLSAVEVSVAQVALCSRAAEEAERASYLAS